jgi:NitT/TauT family transport system permease protein
MSDERPVRERVGPGLALPDRSAAAPDEGSGTVAPTTAGRAGLAPTGPVRAPLSHLVVTRVGRHVRLTTLSVRVVQLALAVGLLGLWELAVATRRADRFFFSQPSAIGAQLASWFTSGFIYQHIGVTLLETLLGFALGTLVGLMVGFVLARSENLADIFEPAMAVLNAMPRVVLAPLFIIWLGLGLESKVALSALVVFIIVFYATFTGIREVDQNVIDNARVLGASDRQLTRHVLIPSALTWIFASLRVSVGFALVGAVVSEYLGANRGVGYLISFAQAMFQSTGVYAGLVVLMLMVLVINFFLRKIEDRFSAWKPERR